MAATNEQVQQYVDQRVRPACEAIRALFTQSEDNIASIDDIYANLTDAPDWTDGRDDHPPHLATPTDVLAWNAFINGLVKFQNGTFADVTEANSFAAQLPVILKLCVRPVVE
ncbi:hypothetical protein [Bremerella cremea]|uniref:hypothetical protein n=1 Tax=Bremerella cremea TaxID=1031537 RepID=UPI0031EA31B2